MWFQIKIYSEDDYIAIDAVEIISTQDFPSCLTRPVPKYRLNREPAFDGGDVLTGELQFVDKYVSYKFEGWKQKGSKCY